MDTSAWVSVADRAEASHERVAAELRACRSRLVTGYHVLHETWTVMRYRHSRREAERLVTAIRNGIARIEVSRVADLEVATIMEPYSPKTFPFRSALAGRSWSGWASTTRSRWTGTSAFTASVRIGVASSPFPLDRPRPL